ncbi:MAG: oligoribonuclease [Gammaproteobacteria bacterium]|nr:oligoribonuclease [Gammaproteobacteria bacterium]MBJ56324.1 oligoribonuclease [Gammaproteobacteria bacterium]HBN13906.1 oligoribonuclease [Pseudohongiella sp.]|tara:strand:- start:104 stop:673 length:570 start_codon:yes stop_codon:yes gene_type:complete
MPDTPSKTSIDKTRTLIWIDMEMTGLEPDTDRIIEVATLVTDSDLNVLAEGPVIAVHQSEEALAAMDEWNQRTHGGSGLVERVRKSTIDDAEAERQTIEFLSQYADPRSSPMCGNSVHQDRRFMVRYMPALEAFFHYRNLDVSTVKELARRWRPELPGGFSKATTHQALDDIRESVDELRYYRQHFFKL